MKHCCFQELLSRLEGGDLLTEKDAFSVLKAPVDELADFADRIRRCFAPESELCAIVSGKSGECSEDCRYCAQSSFYKTGVSCYPLKDAAFLDEAYGKACRNRLNYFSVVTSGRNLPSEDISRLAILYRKWSSNGSVKVCCSHGLLSEEDFRILAEAGVSRYHCNLETSKRFFPSVCTTHTYDDKITTIQKAQSAGLEVCSGALIGMGESWNDRIEIALELRRLGIRSVPLNFLSPIRGTAFESLPVADEETAVRVFAVFRMLLPDVFLRLAGGRTHFKQEGRLLFRAGANAAITGDLLTTAGSRADADRAAIECDG